MSRWKIWVGLVVLFLSGVLIGSVGTRMYVQQQISGILARERPAVRDLFLRRFTQSLDLSEEQRQEVEQIASLAAEKVQKLHWQHRREVQALFDQAFSDMKEHLSPAQQAELDEIRERMKSRQERRRHGPPHMGHPPPPGMRGTLPPPPPPPPPDLPPP